MILDELRDHAQEKLCDCRPDLVDGLHSGRCPMSYFDGFAQAIGLEQIYGSLRNALNDIYGEKWHDVGHAIAGLLGEEYEA